MIKLYNLWYRILPLSLKQQVERGRISQGSFKNQFTYDTALLPLLHCESYSQFAQDAFIFQMIFGGKTDGFFLDIGANEPLNINNSYLFELHGWSGYAFEPIPWLANKWKSVRKSPCINAALGDADEDISFTECSSSTLSHVGHSDETNSYIVPQYRLSSFCSQKGISHVDVVFIDVEGYEMHVLSGIDFDKTDITCICIENDKEDSMHPSQDIRNYIISKGYRLVARLTIDDIFIKESYFLSGESSKP